MKLHRLVIALWAAGCFCAAMATTVHAQTLRIAAYNVNADTDSTDPAGSTVGTVDGGPGLTAVLEAMGQEKLDGHAQPLDVLALEELDIPSGSQPPLTATYI